MQAPVVAQPLAIDQVLVHADRSVGFAATTEQVAQGEMQLDRFRIDFRCLEKRLDGAIGLFVEQEIETLEIGTGQCARFAQQVLEIDARGDPAQRKEYR